MHKLFVYLFFLLSIACPFSSYSATSSELYEQVNVINQLSSNPLLTIRCPQEFRLPRELRGSHCPRECRGRRGRRGPTGPTGPQGIPGTSFGSYIYAVGGAGISDQTFDVGSRVIFGLLDPPVQSGTSVTLLPDFSTFSINEPGSYLIDFEAVTGLSGASGGRIDFFFNGNPSGFSVPFLVPGTALTKQQIIQVTSVPFTVSVNVEEEPLTFAANSYRTMIIIQLGSNPIE
jgi:hypothetical protein